MVTSTASEKLVEWIDDHFDEQVGCLHDMVRIPTDTPPGENAPHADAFATALEQLGWDVEKHAGPGAQVSDYGMQSITNLIVRRRYGTDGPVIALNAHGDVVPPGEGWTK